MSCSIKLLKKITPKKLQDARLDAYMYL